MNNTSLSFKPNATTYGFEPEILVMMTIDFTILLFGILCNLVVIIVIKQMKALHSVTNVQLISLCMSDILHLSSMPMVYYVFYYKTFPSIHKLGCIIYLSLYGFNSTAGIFHLTMLSLDRYMSVCHPIIAKRYQTRSTAFLSVVIVWIIAFFMITPTIMFGELEVDPKRNTKRCFVNYQFNQRINTLILSRIIIGFCIPVIINSIFYGLILIKIWQLTKNKPKRNHIVLVNENSKVSKLNQDAESGNGPIKGKMSMVVSRSSNRQQIHVTKIILTLLVVFVALWLPYYILQFFSVFRTDKKVNETKKPIVSPSLPIISLIFNTLGCLNSLLNPILYGFISTQFRTRVKQSLSSYHLPCGVLTPKSKSNILIKNPVPSYPDEKRTLCCWRYLCICYNTSSYKAIFENRISR